MGQKIDKKGNKNIMIDLNPINNSYYEIYLYNFKNSRNYKSLISSANLNILFKIKKRKNLIEYIEENADISLKELNSILLSFNLEQNKYQFELYNIEDFKNIVHILVTLDYLFISLMLLSLLNVFQYSKSYPFFCLKLLHFILICILSVSYCFYRYYQIFESYYYKFDYKDHFYYILYFLIPVFINIILFIGVIFVTTNDMENICLLGSLGLEGSVLYIWTKEQFEKNTFKDITKYFFEVKSNIKKYIKNKILN